MYAKITPRKTTDRGGYLAMPLKVNIPEPKNERWETDKMPAMWSRVLEATSSGWFYRGYV